MSAVASLTFSGERMLLTGVIDFASVVPLLREGDIWLRQEAPGRCLLDMAGVSSCNSAGTALLLAWLRTAAAAGKTLCVRHPPESLSALMQLAGLDKVLRDVTPTD